MKVAIVLQVNPCKLQEPVQVDPMAVEDVCNVNDKPLFLQFAFED